MNRRGADNCDSLHTALSGLASEPRHATGPDLSRSILGRLGYMRLDERAARRRRTLTWIQRTGACALAVLAFGLAWQVFQASDEVRRPVGRSLTEAVEIDVRMQQERLGGVIQTIRAISGPRLQPIAPASRPGTGAPSGDLPEDVNRSARAPVRWV